MQSDISKLDNLFVKLSNYYTSKTAHFNPHKKNISPLSYRITTLSKCIGDGLFLAIVHNVIKLSHSQDW